MTTTTTGSDRHRYGTVREGRARYDSASAAGTATNAARRGIVVPSLPLAPAVACRWPTPAVLLAPVAGRRRERALSPLVVRILWQWWPSSRWRCCRRRRPVGRRAVIGRRVLLLRSRALLLLPVAVVVVLLLLPLLGAQVSLPCSGPAAPAHVPVVWPVRMVADGQAAACPKGSRDVLAAAGLVRCGTGLNIPLPRSGSTTSTAVCLALTWRRIISPGVGPAV